MTMTGSYSKSQSQGFSNRIERVAIIGAGGQVGKHIVEQLLKSGKHTVTAITRPGSTSKLGDGIRVVRIDYSGNDNTALVKALRGQQVLIITMSATAPTDTVSKLVRVAAEAGVPYVLPNWFGHETENDTLCRDTLFGQFRDSICAEIKSLGVSSYLMLVCNPWYEFSLDGGTDRFGFDFKNRSLIMFDGGNVAINTTTWPQCGRAIANLLSLKEFPDDERDQSPTLSQFRNSSIYISSFRLSQRDMFESVKRVTGTTESDWNLTYESAEKRWKDAQAAIQEGNMTAFTRMLYSRMFFPNGDGDYQSRRGLHNELLHLPVEDLDEITAIGIRMAEQDEVTQFR